MPCDSFGIELPQRKTNRIPGYDYSAPNAYFVTICTDKRRNLFWRDVGAVIGRPQDVPLNHIGSLVAQAIGNIHTHYPVVTVEHYVIMPNHVHILLQIHADDNGRPMAAPTIPQVINQLKGIATKKAGFPLWQKGFYDHVIRSDSDFRDAWNYIEGNPGKWTEET